MRARQAKKIARRVLERAFEVVRRDGGFIRGVNTGEVIAPWRHQTILRYGRKVVRLLRRHGNTP